MVGRILSLVLAASLISIAAPSWAQTPQGGPPDDGEAALTNGMAQRKSAELQTWAYGSRLGREARMLRT